MRRPALMFSTVLAASLVNGCSGGSTTSETTVEPVAATTTVMCCINPVVDDATSTTIAAVGEYSSLYERSTSVVFAEVTVRDTLHAVVQNVQESYGKRALPAGAVLTAGPGWSFPDWDGSLYMLLFVAENSDGTFTILNEGDPAHYDVAELQREVPAALPNG